MVRILTKADIEQVFSMPAAIQATKEALAIYSDGNSVVPLRTVLSLPKYDGTTLFMPAYIDTMGVTGIKIVSVYPNNLAKNKPVIPGKVLLLDATTGDVTAILDGTYLTALRTGALQGAATDLLASKQAKIAALIGTGGQAAEQLSGLLNVRELAEVRVHGRDFGKAQKFAAAMQSKFAAFKTNIVAVSTVDSAVHDADIITAVTTSTTPVFKADSIKPGAHINGIGSYTRAMQELPAEILIKATKVFFDTKAGVLSEAGDILVPLESGKLDANKFAELGEVVLGTKSSRENSTEITVFKSVGSAVFDIVLAQKIYARAQQDNIGNNINF